MWQSTDVVQIIQDMLIHHAYISEEDLNEAKPFLGAKNAHFRNVRINFPESKNITSARSSAAPEDKLHLINLAKKWSHYFARHYPVRP